MNESNANDIKKYNQRNQQIDTRYKTLGRRVYAGMIDGAIISLFSILVELILQLVDLNYRFQIYRISILPFAILFPIITTKIFGGTPGKLYFNLVVLPANEEGNISWLQSILRELLNIFSDLGDSVSIFVYYVLMSQTSYPSYLKFTSGSFLYQLFDILVLGVFIVEIATANMSTKRRSVHDFIAGTVVVKNGPYRKWSNFIAVGSFIILVVLQMKIYNYVHN